MECINVCKRAVKNSTPVAGCQATVAFDLRAVPLKSSTTADFDQLNKKLELFRPTYEVNPTYDNGSCPLFRNVEVGLLSVLHGMNRSHSNKR